MSYDYLGLSQLSISEIENGKELMKEEVDNIIDMLKFRLENGLPVIFACNVKDETIKVSNTYDTGSHFHENSLFLFNCYNTVLLSNQKNEGTND